MATINGVGVRNIKEFVGHGGEPLLQGSVYYKGRRLGNWSQDFSGGSDIMDFDESVLEESVLKVVSTLSGELSEYYSVLSLLLDVATVANMAKEYKYYEGRGYPLMGVAWAVGTGVYSAMGFKKVRDITDQLKGSLIEDAKGYLYEDLIEVDFLIIRSLSDLDMEIGTEQGYRKELRRIEELKRLREEQRVLREVERKKAELSLKELNNGRFIEEEKDGPEVIIRDTLTGRSIVVSLYAKSNVMEALIKMVC